MAFPRTCRLTLRTVLLLVVGSFMIASSISFIAPRVGLAIAKEKIMAPRLRFLTVEASAKHTATVIFAHGLGDTGYGFEPVADHFNADPTLSHVKWVLPHSPLRPVTLNMGTKMPAWFDVVGLDGNHPEDEKGMLESAEQLTELIAAEEQAGIDTSRIVLGGFSQGAAMALLTGLSTPKKLAGVVALSGWLPLSSKFKIMASSHATSVPVFFGHGTQDAMVAIDKARRSAEFLKSEIGFPAASDFKDAKGLSFNEYPGLPHSVGPKELADLKVWLNGVLPQEPPAKI